MAARVLFVSGRGSGNTLRYRVRYAEEALRASGVATNAVHFSEPGLARWAREADAVVFYRTPGTQRVLSLIAHLRSTCDVRIAFDIDDLVFLPSHIESIPFLNDLAPAQRVSFEESVRACARVVPLVDAATGSTSPVVEDLSTLTAAPVSVLPNGVSQSALAAAQDVARSTDPAKVRIGYFSGSATHDRDWAQVEQTVVDLLRLNRNTELWLVGPVAHSPALRDVMSQVRFVDFVPWRQLPALLASVDINIAPLEVTPFTEGKSAIKWLEAALVGTPTIATSTRPFQDSVADGRDALLVHEPGQWPELLSRLIGDVALRREVGQQARESALASFGPQVQADRYRHWLEDLIARPRADVQLGEVRRLAHTQPRVWGLGTGLQDHEFPSSVRSECLADPPLAGVVAALRRANRRWRSIAVRVASGVRRRLVRVSH